MTSVPPIALSARDIMTARPVTLHPEMDVFQGIEILIKHDITGAPVIDEQRKLLGVFSEKSCMQVLVDAAYEQLPTNQLGAFMNQQPDTIEENTQLLSIIQIFLNTPRRILPVLRDGQLVGLVSRRDVIRAAAKVISAAPDHESTLLYLSALRGMEDAPDV